MRIIFSRQKERISVKIRNWSQSNIKRKKMVLEWILEMNRQTSDKELMDKLLLAGPIDAIIHQQIPKKTPIKRGWTNQFNPLLFFYFAKNFSAMSWPCLILAHCCGMANSFPESQEAKPHWWERKRRSFGIILLASSKSL